ncbi:hypothetical protein BO71DRAFT_472742 [Aspergillus ellipticus CBS 707.79]|uniref:DUF676 domain-containing protein n=1 Tax=Aspergillus ellipticus CBS 707.79 TaxID=1448320 RepID=A0A319DFF5_9EURO|nr:hypothetical protein BO71DRAFT_472742 [Aspergillus ellipticus CBS 707.79]
MAASSEINGERPRGLETAVDIVAVPAIGADSRNPWTDGDSQTPWLTSELTRVVSNARVLLFDHGHLDPRDDLKSLAHRLIKWLLQERQATSLRRPIFFLCHSTGGLVVKAALTIASQLTSKLGSILSSCYGIAFLATPHHGSSYLSAPEFTRSVHHLMRLKHRISSGLREIFRPRHPYLLQLSSQFKSISADMRIWTFLETVDSTLSITDPETGSTVDMHVPITSIRSGILDFEHEKEIPLATDHVGTASFRGQELTTRVVVHVNGFFEDTARGISDETPLKLWSTKTTLKEYLTNGPSHCLKDRLKKTAGIPINIYDDSSISSFDSRPTSAHVRPSLDGIDASPATNPRRPSLKQSRSFLGQTSPRIHISEPASEEYFGAESEPSEDTRGPVVPSQEGGLEDITKNSIDASSNNNIRLRENTPPRYKNFLPIPLLPRDKGNEEKAEKPRKVPRFDQPEAGSERLLWIHVPYTHTGWVPSILSKACDDQERQKFSEDFINEENWYSNLIRARHLEPHARYVRPACIYFKGNGSSPLNAGGEHDPRLALYLHWDTYLNLVQRRKVVGERLQQGRFRPVPGEISNSSLESKLIWNFLGNEPPIHIRRTLDQFGYPNLRSTVARDDDQMLWKRTKKLVNRNDEIGDAIGSGDGTESKNTFMDGKVLMVDQLWLWVADDKTVVTFFPNQEATTAEGKLYEQSNLYNSIYNELNGDLARRFETAGDLASLIVLHAITVLLDRTLHRDLQVLRIFEESISILTEIVTKSFKRFRNRGFNTRPADYNKNAEGKAMSASERDERDNQAARRNREDLSTLLELRDIVDELGTILKLLDQQTTTVKSMSSYFEHKGYGKVFIGSALSRLDDYRNQVLEMRENASVAQKAVENLLDLKQKQASVDESRLARWEAEVTQDQSRSVMVFTIFTIIFLPLSFFTSLFGINAREWSGESANLTLGEMLYISGPASFAIITLALLIAFNERLREALWLAQKLVLDMIADTLLAPVTLLFRWRKSSSKTSSSASASANKVETSRAKGRLNRYRRNPQRQSQEDIWTKHEDKMAMHQLPAVPGLENEGERQDYYSEKLKERFSY